MKLIPNAHKKIPMMFRAQVGGDRNCNISILTRKGQANNKMLKGGQMNGLTKLSLSLLKMHKMYRLRHTEQNLIKSLGGLSPMAGKMMECFVL